MQMKALKGQCPEILDLHFFQPMWAPYSYNGVVSHMVSHFAELFACAKMSAVSLKLQAIGGVIDTAVSHSVVSMTTLLKKIIFLQVFL